MCFVFLYTWNWVLAVSLNQKLTGQEKRTLLGRHIVWVEQWKCGGVEMFNLWRWCAGENSLEEIVGLCWMCVCLIILHSHCRTDKLPVLICTGIVICLVNFDLEYEHMSLCWNLICVDGKTPLKRCLNTQVVEKLIHIDKHSSWNRIKWYFIELRWHRVKLKLKLIQIIGV